MNEPPYYKSKNFDNEDLSLNKINWITDKLVSKEEFLYEKFGISNLRQNIYRVIIFILILLLNYAFPCTVSIFCYYLGVQTRTVKNEFLTYNSLVSAVSIILVIFYVKSSWTNKAFSTLCVLSLFILMLIFYFIRVILGLI